MGETLLSLLPLVLVILIGGLIWAKVRKGAKNAPPALAGGALIPEYKGPLAFFRRHYNGDYSLGRSYWLNTFVVSLFAPLFGLMLLPWLSENFPARYGSAGFLFITALGIVAWFWAVAGTWASAGKHVQRGGRAGWATAAKFMIVLGVLKTFGDVGNLMPVLSEHWRVALGEQPGEATRLEVRADGRSILLSGGINDGSAQQLAKALDMAPSVKTVVLSSEGGWIREGKLLADVIRQRGLDTYVEGHCASACTIAFLAGRERAAAPSARVGFHASRAVGSTESTPPSSENAEIREIYRQAGLPDVFVRRALSTPADNMWYPSHEEMLSARVLTRESLGGETAAVSTAVRSREQLALEFKKIEMYSALAQRMPRDFDVLIDTAWAAVQRGATDAEVTAATRAQIMELLPRYLPMATDETLVAYQALMLEQIEALRQKDARACVEMAFPSGQSMRVVSNLPPDLGKREGALMAQVVREADPSRAIKPSRQELERVAQRAARGMSQEQLAVFGDKSVRSSSSPAAICDAAVAFFGGLNSIPLAERGKALRVLYASN